MRSSPLQFSHLTDEEFLKHLHTKSDPTDEDNEAALRLELLLGAYREFLEKIHRLASEQPDARAALTRIRNLTAPENDPQRMRLQ